MKMLEGEGFAFDGYVDIFDGGPTVCCRTDHIRTARDSRVLPIAGFGDDAPLPRALLAKGELATFRAWMSTAQVSDDGLVLPQADARIHGLSEGDFLRHVAA
jgi:arginine N-succinyltransferase